jgi:hypothetical protein
MSNEAITSLPQAANATLTDILYAVQGYTSPSSPGTSVQETVQQLLSLITAGTNISVAFTGGNLQISATGLAGIGWNLITTTSANMVADNGYTANNASLVTLTLPSTAAYGTLIYVTGLGAGGWKIAQNVGQQIIIGSSSSTSGSSGYIASSNQYDSIVLLCAVANTTWTCLGAPQGIITLA